MNKNPERPENMDDIISGVFNPKSKNKKSPGLEKYFQTQKQIERDIFGDD